MPKIKEYGIRTEVAGPVGGRRATGEDVSGLGQGLQRVGDAGQDLARIIKERKEQADISDLHAKFSQAHAKHTVKWRETLMSADPSKREEVMKKFMEDYDSEINSIGESVASDRGRKFFTQKQAEQRAYFLERADHTMAQLAGEKAKFDAQESIRSWASSLREDPAGFQLAYSNHERYVNELQSSGMISKVHAEQLRQVGAREFAQNAVRGWIAMSPEEGIRQLENGKWNDYIDGDTKQQLLLTAKQGIEARRVAEERERVAAERRKRAQQDDRMGQLLDKFYNDEGKFDKSFSVKEVIDDPLLSYQQKEHWIRAAKAAKEPKKDDSAEVAELIRRIHLPVDSPQKIDSYEQVVSWVADGRIRPRSISLIQRELLGKGTQEYEIEKKKLDSTLNEMFTEIAKPDPISKIPDPEGARRFARFKLQFLDAFYEGKKKGVEINDMLSRDGANSLIKRFNPGPRTMNERLESGFRWMFGGDEGATTAPKPAVPQRREGESLEEYRKRIAK